MRYILLFLYVWVIVSSFAVCPFPFNATGKENQVDSQHTEEKAKSLQPPAPLPNQRDRTETKNSEKGAAPATSSGEPKAVRITKIPPPDRWYKTYVVATIALVVVGIVGIVTALCTLGIMKQQTKAAETAAKAAESNIKLLIDKERARLRVNVLDFEFWKPVELEIVGAPAPIQDLKAHPVCYRVLFDGTTPAFIAQSNAEVIIAVSQDILIDHLNAPARKMINLPDIIRPDTELDRLFALPPGFSLTKEQIDQIKSGHLFVHFCGFIRYKDVFDIARETVFHYRWQPYSEAFLIGVPEGKWEQCGQPKDNYAT